MRQSMKQWIEAQGKLKLREEFDKLCKLGYPSAQGKSFAHWAKELRASEELLARFQKDHCK